MGSATIRTGLLMIAGGLGCLVAHALLVLATILFLSMISAEVAHDLSLLFIPVGWVRSLLLLAGCVLLIAGPIAMQRDVNPTSRGLLFGIAGLAGIALLLNGMSFALYRIAPFAPNFIEGIIWLEAVCTRADAGFLILAVAVLFYFLLSLDYSEAEFRQGMFAFVAPGRGFVGGMIFVVLGLLQLGFSLGWYSLYWFGDVALLASAVAGLIATYNRLPPAQPVMQPGPYGIPPGPMQPGMQPPGMPPGAYPGNPYANQPPGPQYPGMPPQYPPPQGQYPPPQG